MDILNSYNTSVAFLKQACDDIKNDAESIISKWGNKTDLYITIQFSPNEAPTISINREHFVTVTDEIMDMLGSI